MEEMKAKTLEDLVPPLELCKAAREVIGDQTALVWAHTGRGYEVTSREVWEIIEVCFDAIPAPTLAELLEMLPKRIEDGELNIGIGCGYLEYLDKYGCLCGSFFECIEDGGLTTAALRLLMKVKGATK